VATQRRRTERRRHQRRAPAGGLVDVTRLEHENLYGQVEEILRTLLRIERELEWHARRLSSIEGDLEATVKQKGA
jgi:hypothetical protein